MQLDADILQNSLFAINRAITQEVGEQAFGMSCSAISKEPKMAEI